MQGKDRTALEAESGLASGRDGTAWLRRTTPSFESSFMLAIGTATVSAASQRVIVNQQECGICLCRVMLHKAPEASDKIHKLNKMVYCMRCQVNVARRASAPGIIKCALRSK